MMCLRIVDERNYRSFNVYDAAAVLEQAKVKIFQVQLLSSDIDIRHDLNLRSQSLCHISMGSGVCSRNGNNKAVQRQSSAGKNHNLSASSGIDPLASVPY